MSASLPPARSEPTPTPPASAASSGPPARATSFGAGVLVALVRVYQVALSPIFGGQCRYYPTCSAYAIEALQKHGALRGSWMAARRIGRCHPFRPGGYDPVP